MSRAQFRWQAVCVITLIGLVSWPEYRPVRATATMWRTNSPLAADRDLSSDTRLALAASPTQRAVVGYGTATTSQESGAALTPAMTEMVAHMRDDQGAQALPDGTQAAIIGRARTALNTPVAYARVLLRNLRTGQIEAEATADQEGRFSFLNLKAAGYVVEMLGRDGKVMATSQAVATATGQAQVATVRVASTSTAKALFSPVTTATAPDTLRTAAQNNVATVTQQSTGLSPRQ